MFAKRVDIAAQYMLELNLLNLKIQLRFFKNHMGV